jgi:hypothetical protein
MEPEETEKIDLGDPSHEDPAVHSFNREAKAWITNLVYRVIALEAAFKRHGIEVEEVKS